VSAPLPIAFVQVVIGTGQSIGRTAVPIGRTVA
jgi:hypothetical protein